MAGHSKTAHPRCDCGSSTVWKDNRRCAFHARRAATRLGEQLDEALQDGHETLTVNLSVPILREDLELTADEPELDLALGSFVRRHRPEVLTAIATEPTEEQPTH